MKTLAERLKRIRGKMSQADFGAAFGVSQRSISRYETGGGSPDLDTINAICAKYDVSPEWLAFGIGPMRQGEAGNHEAGTPMVATATDSAKLAPNESLIKQVETANERLWQTLERERGLQKEIGELKSRNAALEERLDAQEGQSSRDMRGLYELQEEEIRSEQTFAKITPSRTPTK